MKTTAVVLAAGKGTRMVSKLPKVLHQIGGRPLIWHALQAVYLTVTETPIVVIGHEGEEVRNAVADMAEFITQDQQLGTGHALQQVEPLLRGNTDLVLVTSADMPLLTENTLQSLVQIQPTAESPISLLTVVAQNSRGFGRIVRNDSGTVASIVEESHITPQQSNTKEFNVGAYCFLESWLWGALKKIPTSSKGELYLTDLIGIASQEGLSVKSFQIEDPSEAIGINTRVHLAEAGEVVRKRINQTWMQAGVTLVDPNTTYIDMDVTVGQDTIILPNTLLQGDTHIGVQCEVGPNTIIRDTKIGNHCQIVASILEEAIVEDNVDIGPFSHLRSGAHLSSGVHIGNFAEVKKSHLKAGVKMGHFSYIGDATIGENVNIGAGTITANYDGKNKHHTEIGADAFIGSDTMLVAPLKIGKGARTGAGSVVTKDVPDSTVVVGIPARAVRKNKDKQ